MKPEANASHATPGTRMTGSPRQVGTELMARATAANVTLIIGRSTAPMRPLR